MKAHTAIECLHNLRRLGQMPGDQADLLIRKISESVKIQFDFGDYPQMKEAALHEHVGKLHLPFPLCYFEIPHVGGLLAREIAREDEYILIHPFLQKADGQHGTWPPEVLLAIDKNKCGVVSLSEDPAIQKDMATSAHNEKHRAIISGLPSLVILGLAVLNCTNVVMVDNPEPVALNKKRLKHGKLPLFSYKTLHLKKQETEVRSSAEQNSLNRCGPRLHLRRGHVRRLDEARSVWVQSCMVGNSTRGIVMKDYRVTI